MYPKPKMWGKKTVTVCIAGIQEDREAKRVFLVCDRRLSIEGGIFSHEGFAKYRPLNEDWVCMFAGDVEETRLMMKHVSASLRKLKSKTFEAVLDCCREAYAHVRKRLIETQILPEFDVRTYAEFRRLKKTDEAFYLKINALISKAQDGWNLLFAGFDDQKIPHVFVLSGPGNVNYCDSQGFAVIGSGAFAAHIWLSFIGYHPRLPLGNLMFGLMSAKFFAERAEAVGATTVVSMIEAGEPYLAHLNDEQIQDAKQAWESLPKYSEDVARELDASIQAMRELLKQTKATMPPSISQK